MTKNEQKIINFMINEPQLDFLALEIQKAAKVSKVGANLSLKSLAKQNLVSLQKRGKVYLYSVNFADPEIKELKKINNIKKLKPFVKKISKYNLKTVLFGSAARGENFKDSDFDLFILTRKSKKIRQALSKQNKIQAIIKTPIELIRFEKENPVLVKEINSSIVLWQQH